jgi:endonuclease/exonuclease/phosphatase family metal-dependent hydrolase
MKKYKYPVLVLVLVAIGGGAGWYCYGSQWDPSPDELTICSFNIQFLGSSKKRDDETLSQILKDFDIVVVQELVAPPTDGNYPDGKKYSADPEAAEFFKAMQDKGFVYHLSEEDTGTNNKIHTSGTSTEWWVAFYKPQSVEYANDLPCGFLADDRSNNKDFERVPYAFAFRTPNDSVNFVLISVHLKPGKNKSDKKRRSQELSAIAKWIDKNDSQEKDFIILGDMNIQNVNELVAVTPDGFVSLNDECYATNTNLKKPKPYDHVMYNPVHTDEIDTQKDIHVIALVEAVKPYWKSKKVAFPGKPYKHNLFRKYYSDHNPIVFNMSTSGSD